MFVLVTVPASAPPLLRVGQSPWPHSRYSAKVEGEKRGRGHVTAVCPQTRGNTGDTGARGTRGGNGWLQANHSFHRVLGDKCLLPADGR